MQADIIRTLSTRAGLIIASIGKILKFPASGLRWPERRQERAGQVEKYFIIKYIEIIQLLFRPCRNQ
jgi:hypothetical protein